MFINDYLAGGVSPAKYLRTEEMGGERAQKRFERGLSTRGLLSGGQEATPGPAAELDGQGQLSGGGITRLLSRVGALSEVGYSGNATRGSFERGIRAQAAKALGKGASREDRRQAAAGAYIPAVRITGTDFFVAKSKLSEGYMGVFSAGWSGGCAAGHLVRYAQAELFTSIPLPPDGAEGRRCRRGFRMEERGA
ncbi:MAG: hypothetical protein WDN04_14980 [Rhodospirillales bacterium]